jgi:hypothetical protein
MKSAADEIVKDSFGNIIGFVHGTPTGFEAWKRERLGTSAPGNKHSLIQTFNTIEEARVAVAASGNI